MKKTSSLASWIDAAELGRIVARLREPSRSSGEEAPAHGAREAGDPAARLIGAVPRPSDSSDGSDGSDRSGPPAALSLPSRLAVFGEWVRGEVPCGAVFLADEQGNPLLSHAADPGLVSSAVRMADATRREVRHVEPGPGRCLEARLAGGDLLSVAHVASARGSFHFGLVTHEAVARETLARVLSRLEDAIEGMTTG